MLLQHTFSWLFFPHNNPFIQKVILVCFLMCNIDYSCYTAGSFLKVFWIHNTIRVNAFLLHCCVCNEKEDCNRWSSFSNLPHRWWEHKHNIHSTNFQLWLNTVTTLWLLLFMLKALKEHHHMFRVQSLIMLASLTNINALFVLIQSI